jgi:hypothetical protein
MTEEEIQKLINDANLYIETHKDIRFGQALMIMLGERDIQLYREVTRNDQCDPFYCDSKIAAFLKFITKGTPV